METEDRMTNDRDNDKDKDKDKDKKEKLSDDPPILVGGGGSTLIWIKKGTMPKLVTPPAVVTGVPPAHPDQYYVFECDTDIKKIDAKDGKGGGSQHPNVDKDKHRTVFDV
jgi:hypothetical protein